MKTDFVSLPMTMQEAREKLSTDLESIYDKSEASAISEWVIEHLTGSKSADRAFYRERKLTNEQEQQLYLYERRLLQHEPVQYVLQESWFCGLKLYVDKNVLIPRPETEELVEWVISNCKFPVDRLSILDIGSGSGCIPIALKRKIRKSDTWSVDTSEEALAVAKRNALTLGVDVRFVHMDFLNEKNWAELPVFDIIISNPPYIPAKDKVSMRPNVVQHEPPIALFVPDEDSLIFYRAIAEFGKEHLNKGGQVYAEIHEDLGEGVSKLFIDHGYSVELKQDMQQKTRMLKAWR